MCDKVEYDEVKAATYTQKQQRDRFKANPFETPKCFDTTDECKQVVVQKGMEGCSAIDLSNILKPLMASGGIIYMIAGLILTFAGGYFIQATLGLIIFLFTTAFILITLFLF